MSAFANITPIVATKPSKFSEAGTFSSLTTAVVTNGATTATLGAYFTMNDKDGKYLLFAQNAHASSAYDLTIKAGNGIQGVKDLTIEIAAGKFVIIQIESGRFKNVTENATLKELSSATEASQVSAKGKVFVVGEAADIKVAVFKLPC